MYSTKSLTDRQYERNPAPQEEHAIADAASRRPDIVLR